METEDDDEAAGQYAAAMATGVERDVVRRATAAAKDRKASKEPIAFREALEEAPWDPELPAAWESVFRQQYARALVKRGLALAPAKSGGSGTPGYETKLMRRPFSATEAEFAQQDERAAAAGLSWSAWARRKLSEEHK